MIKNISHYHHKPIPAADICIIGAGAAGLELATQLASTYSITLLEAGFMDFEAATQKLCQFKQIGRPIRTPDYTQPLDLEKARLQQTRIRQYGGSTNIWGGKWKALTPWDLIPKSFYAKSGWPISFETLYPYYKDIAKDYGVLDLLNFLENPDQFPADITKCACFTPSINLLENIPTNSGAKFQSQIAESTTINLILGANVVNMRLDHDLQYVEHVLVRASDGFEWSVKAQYFILAGGTIENTRLLLCSNSQLKTGLGNTHDLVGRYLMDHPKLMTGVLYPHTQRSSLAEGKTFFDHSNHILEIGIALHPHLLQELELPHHNMRIYTYKDLAGKFIYPTQFHLEQLPYAKSRIFLAEEKDPLGMPLACLDWKFSEADFTSFKRYIDNITLLLESNKIGTLCLDDPIEAMNFMRDANHQMGTTRMAKNPQDGVVDSDCKVFGVANLFLCGSSVFPTAGNANPTFTILALTRRLANLFKKFINPNNHYE